MSDGDQFEWNDNKRIATLEKHGIDFVDAVAIFVMDPLIYRSTHLEEERFVAIGQMNTFLIAVVFTRREVCLRIITARRARANERRKYDAYVVGRGVEN